MTFSSGLGHLELLKEIFILQFFKLLEVIFGAIQTILILMIIGQDQLPMHLRTEYFTLLTVLRMITCSQTKILSQTNPTDKPILCIIEETLKWLTEDQMMASLNASLSAIQVLVEQKHLQETEGLAQWARILPWNSLFKKTMSSGKDSIYSSLKLLEPLLFIKMKEISQQMVTFLITNLTRRNVSLLLTDRVL